MSEIMKRISGSNIHKLMYIRSLTFRSFCSLKDTMDAITQGREFAFVAYTTRTFPDSFWSLRTPTTSRRSLTQLRSR